MTIEKKLLRFDEVRTILDCSDEFIRKLLREGKLQGHSPDGKPGTGGRCTTKVTRSSLEKYLQKGVIPASAWNKQ
jgi:hypothetical protein